MSPIETAKAFDAPALQGAGTNLPVDELLAVYKKTPLKYGAARAPDGLIKLTLGTSEIEKPVVGSTFTRLPVGNSINEIRCLKGDTTERFYRVIFTNQSHMF